MNFLFQEKDGDPKGRHKQVIDFRLLNTYITYNNVNSGHDSILHNSFTQFQIMYLQFRRQNTRR